jgi:tetrahydrodipicolinate N-succinyltransferase
VRRPDSIVDVWTPSGEVALEVGDSCEVGARNFPGAGPEIPERAVLLTNVAGTASAVALSRALLSVMAKESRNSSQMPKLL